MRRVYLVAIVVLLSAVAVTVTIVLVRSLNSSSTELFDDDCRIPPDFWCIHQEISQKCGTLTYCNNSNWPVSGRLELTVAYESLCPDSQGLVVDRLYPNVLNQTNIRDRIDIRMLPWGWAKRDEQGNVTCQHGPSECHGNIQLSCMFAQSSIPIEIRYQLTYCIESLLRQRRLAWIFVNDTVVDAVCDECYQQSAIDTDVQTNIRYDCNTKG